MTAPIRAIELVAYGDGCPDALAEPAPTWSEMAIVMFTSAVRAARSDLTGEWSVGPDLDGLSEVEARWWCAVAIAAAAGCPPHWADMGFVPDDESWWHEGADISVHPPDDVDTRWWVHHSSPTRRFTAEIEARLDAFSLIDGGGS